MTDLQFVDFFGLKIVKSERKFILDALRDTLLSASTLRITTMNAQIAYFFLTNDTFRAAIQESLVIPDGVGVAWAVKKIHALKVFRFPGVELGMELCQLGAKLGISIFLLGSKPGIAEQAGEYLHRETGIIIAGCFHGFSSAEEKTQLEICQKIRESGASLLYVALGAPKQEIWLKRYFGATGAKIGIGSGGSLDVWAGVVKRAPKWIQRVNLEWLYRILQSPRKKFKVVFQLIQFISIIRSKLREPKISP